MKKIITLVILFCSIPVFGQVESYKTIIYTSDDLADDLQVTFDESQSRGLGSDLLNAGLGALKGIGAGYVTTLVDFGVNFIGELITKKSRNQKEWNETITKESEHITNLCTIAELNDFYDRISFDGPMDPRGMKFDGIGCLKMIDKDTSFFMSCHINRDKLNRIVEHSKFELVLDTLIIDPFKSGLPNTKLNIPFSFEDRENFTLNISFEISSSWMDQLPQMNKDQVLGGFYINVPITAEDLNENNKFVYVRGETNSQEYSVVGESFIVPRSYLSIRDQDKRMRHTWGTGEYKISVKILETCGVSEQYQKNWEQDFKRRKKMLPKEKFWAKTWKTISSQKWDEIAKSWVVTTLKAPADVLTKEVVNDLHLNSGAAAQQGNAGNKQAGKK